MHMYIPRRLLVLSVVFALNLTGCSGDLGRWEAKHKIAHSESMCNPCFLRVSKIPTNRLTRQLILLGYLSPHSMQATELGRRVLGDHFLLHKGDPYLGAYKKEIDEVTGIGPSSWHAGGLNVQYTYRLIPVLDLTRDPQIGIPILGNLRSIQEIGTIIQSGGQFDYFSGTGAETFLKYDDGWRIDPLYSEVPILGGVAESSIDRVVMLLNTQ